jgi:Tfp pilus assembly protein PilN
MSRDFSSRARRTAPSSHKGWMAAGIVALLLSLGAAVHARRELSQARGTLDAANADLDRARGRLRALQSAKWPVDEVLASQIVQGAEAPPVAVLAALEKVLPEDVKLNTLALSYGKQLDVEMRVTARRSEAYDEFLARLDGSTSFRNIVPLAENREGSVTATVRARFRSLS